MTRITLASSATVMESADADRAAVDGAAMRERKALELVKASAVKKERVKKAERNFMMVVVVVVVVVCSFEDDYDVGCGRKIWDFFLCGQHREGRRNSRERSGSLHRRRAGMTSRYERRVYRTSTTV